MNGLWGPGYEAFEDGWERWVEKTAYAELYWDHGSFSWKTYPAQKLVLSNTAFPPLVVYFPHPVVIWPKLVDAWKTVSKTPRAIWSPHSYRWYTWADRTPHLPPPPPPPPGREREMLAELKRLDDLYARGEISAAERQRQRDEILRRYQSAG